MSILLKLDSATAGNGLSENFSVSYEHLRLDATQKYEIAMVSASIWYSWRNISATLGNNTFDYTWNNGTNWANVTIPDGMYSGIQLQDYVKAKVLLDGHSLTGIVIAPNYSTLKFDIILEAGYRIDLTGSDLNLLLGFTKKIVTATESGTSTADITGGINSLLIHCSATDSSFINSTASDIIHSFSPDLPPGSLLQVEPQNRIYLPLNTTQLRHINMRITDQDGHLIGLNGEDVTYLLHVRKMV